MQLLPLSPIFSGSDDDWINDLRNHVVQNDTEFHKCTVNSFDSNHDSSDRLIVESVYVNADVALSDPALPEDEGPPDPSVAKALLQFRYKCRLNSLIH